MSRWSLHRNPWLPASLGFAAALASSAATASDFNFTVPVSVTNLPSEIVAMQVGCTVLRDDGRIIGTGDAIQPIAGGAFTGDVRIGIDVVGPDKLRAATYRCEIHSFRTAATAAGAREYLASGGPSPMPHAAGGPFQINVSGPIPGQPRPPQAAPASSGFQAPNMKGLPRPPVPSLPK